MTGDQWRVIKGIAADALEQLRQLTQDHAALGGQVLALERQVRTLLIERLELSAQVASLQRENAKLRGERDGSTGCFGPRRNSLEKMTAPMTIRYTSMNGSSRSRAVTA